MKYTADIKYDGVTLAHDVDFDLEVEVNRFGEVEVTRVLLDGKDLIASVSTVLNTVGGDIIFQAEQDEDIQHKVLEAAGKARVGGYNNPDAQWVNA